MMKDKILYTIFSRNIIVIALFFHATTVGQGQCPPLPTSFQALQIIVNDPRYNQEKFIKGMNLAAELKPRLTRNSVSSIKYIYGLTIPNNGDCVTIETIKQNNDLIYEIVLSENYNKDIFISSLNTAESIIAILRKDNSIDEFNRKCNTQIPLSGYLSKQQAEYLIYDLIGKKGLSLSNYGKFCEPESLDFFKQPGGFLNIFGISIIVALVLLFSWQIIKRKIAKNKLILPSREANISTSIKNLIVEGKIKEAINRLEKIAETKNDSQLKKTCILLQSNLHDIENRYNRNLIDLVELRVERARISEKLLNLIHNIQNEY